eukprot:scaffold3840_cov129-Cylindrotheca_fusiformis.AAC.9
MQDQTIVSRTKRRKLDKSLSYPFKPLGMRKEMIVEKENSQENESQNPRKRRLRSEKRELLQQRWTKQRSDGPLSIGDAIGTDREGRYMTRSLPKPDGHEGDLPKPDDHEGDHMSEKGVADHTINATPPLSPCPSIGSDCIEKRIKRKDETEKRVLHREKSAVVHTTIKSNEPHTRVANNDCENCFLKVEQSNIVDSRFSVWKVLKRWWKLMVVTLFCSSIMHSIYSKQPFHKDCVYVNGGGFSGFWYMLGKLYKLREEEQTENYVCYSAGCLGAVSVVANRSFEELFDSAVSIQNKWKNGSLSRFDALETFVDDLIGRNSTLDVTALSHIHILTSEPTRFGWEMHVNTPVDVEHLRMLLIQTAWIPFVTGKHFWHSTGHLDGGFSRLQHPTCRHHISLPWNLRLLMNCLNINMGKEDGRTISWLNYANWNYPSSFECGYIQPHYRFLLATYGQQFSRKVVASPVLIVYWTTTRLLVG